MRIGRLRISNRALAALGGNLLLTAIIVLAYGSNWPWGLWAAWSR